MTLPTWWPDKCIDNALRFGVFVQRMANRLIVGLYRYNSGAPLHRFRFLTRLKLELAAYERTGNQEHLINVANYAHLEMEAPEHPTAHFKEVDFSVTRDQLPNSLKTEIVMTLNLRSWRNFFRLRCSPAAHPQMRQIAVPMLAEFKRLIPVVFDDLHPDSRQAGGAA